MDDQKIENLLNISLEVSESEREKSRALSTGYNPNEKTWELIIKYVGDITYLESKYPGTQVKELLNQYAVVVTAQSNIELLSKETNVEFIEKPKLLQFELLSGLTESCINSVQQGVNNPYSLFGEGTIVAIIDSGIDATRQEFRTTDGQTRILNIWDQDADVEVDRNEINAVLNASSNSQTGSAQIPGRDLIGHGTDVALIACGNNGVAGKADIIVVKMGLGSTTSFPRTTQLMEAVDYVIRKGIEYQKPVAINISFGNNYGDHTGTSLLESFLNEVSDNWKTTICVGTGNEGLGATHAAGYLTDDTEREIEIAINEYETSVNIQIWKDYWDDFDVEILTPSGVNLGKISRYSQVNRLNIGQTTLLTYYGQPSPFSIRQEIYIDMIPNAEYIDAGIWKLRLIPNKILFGRYDIWLPAIGSLNIGTGFLSPDSSLTFTIPSTAEKVISVGAYDSRTNTSAPFSGRGYVSQVGGTTVSKPEIVAPGVGIQLNLVDQVTGTSFATPFVTGAAALMMEWGIVKENDPYLYSDKIKAYLIKGARPLSSQRLMGLQSDGNAVRFTREGIPNPELGWGTLCLKNSLPV